MLIMLMLWESVCTGVVFCQTINHTHHIYDEKVTSLQYLLSVLAEKQHLLGTATLLETRATFHSPRSVNECIVKFISHSSVFSQASAVLVKNQVGTLQSFSPFV